MLDFHERTKYIYNKTLEKQNGLSRITNLKKIQVTLGKQDTRRRKTKQKKLNTENGPHQKPECVQNCKRKINSTCFLDEIYTRLIVNSTESLVGDRGKKNLCIREKYPLLLRNMYFVMVDQFAKTTVENL